MAGRPRKTTDSENTTVTKNVEKVDVTKENDVASYTSIELDELKKENAELRAQMQLILEKLSAQDNVKSSDNVSIQADAISKEISPTRLVNVISLSDGGVSLKTAPTGGKVFRFDKFGHRVSMLYTDLQDVIATDRTFIEDGTVYICDEDVVRNNYLEDVYSKFLTIDTINNIFSFPTEQIVEMVSNTTETLQESIIALIVKKINNNEYVDMNKVDAIGKACKKPCDISALALQKRSQ